MATPRVYWKGHLRLSLVSIEVALYAATERKSKLSLHQIHEPTGRRIRYEKVVPGHGPVDPDEIVKGFEINNKNYVVVQPEELEQIRLETRHTINLVQFVDYGEIDPRFHERPYYVMPQDDNAAEGFVVIREALRQKKKVGCGQMAMRGREYLVAVVPCGRGLLLQTLRYAEEVRDAEAIFDDVPDIDIDQEMLDLASELIDRKSAAFDPSVFEDSYATALRELIESKRKDKAIIGSKEKEEGRKSAEVVDLMDALKKSVAENKSSSGKKKKSGKQGGSGSKKSSPRKSAKKAG